MEGMIGRTLGHYRIVEQIGAGGTGEVCCIHRLSCEAAS